MEIDMKECGLMIESKVMEHYKCRQETRIMENGRIVKSMEKDYINLAIKTIMKGSLCKG